MIIKVIDSLVTSVIDLPQCFFHIWRSLKFLGLMQFRLDAINPKFNRQHLVTNTPFTGCQLKTFKTFILMVKPLKPLFFSEKPLKTFI